MSEAAVLRLAEAQRVLARALDSGGADAIDAAAQSLARTLETVRGIGAWHPTPELRTAIGRALREGEGARIRTRYLAEHGRVKLSRLQALTGRGTIGYGRDGRYRAA